MELPPIISEYFGAWNRHDASGIIACFTEDGLYHDPYVPKGVGGDALARYTQGVFNAFRDIRFDIVAIYVSPTAIIVEWMMIASLAVEVPGVDIFTVAADKIVKVQGYYDRKTFESQRKSS
jgi:limonene-1,2-epoxide hydrolase